MATNLTVFISKISDGEAMNLSEITSSIDDTLDELGVELRRSFETVVIADGSVDPEKLIQTADGWNGEIVERARAATKQWLEAEKLGSPLTHQAKVAFAMADGDFSPYAYKIVMKQDEDFSWCYNPTTIFPKEMLEDVKENPQNYIVVQVAVD